MVSRSISPGMLWAGSLFSKLSSFYRDTRDTSLFRWNDELYQYSQWKIYQSLQVYVPCTLIVVLSWVGFWLNREATSDRVGLGEKLSFWLLTLALLISPFPGITAVLTLSTIALDSRTGLPKVHYATALDWFIICSFLYCMASLLEFAGVHYFTKVHSGFYQILLNIERSLFLPSGQSDNTTLYVCKI